MTGLSSLSASQGVQASMRLFDRSAAAATLSPGGPDIVDGMVGMRVAATDVKANIAVARAADEMLGFLLDIRA